MRTMAAAVAELPAVHDIPEGLAIIRGGRSVARRLDNDRQAEFALLRFPRRTWADTGYELRYHIYTGDGEPISVAANSAIEAIVNSGILRPLKVVRGRPPTGNLAACVSLTILMKHLPSRTLIITFPTCPTLLN